MRVQNLTGHQASSGDLDLGARMLTEHSSIAVRSQLTLVLRLRL